MDLYYKKFVVVLTLIITSLFAITVNADTAGRYWSKHASSKQKVMQLWKEDAPLEKIGQAIYQLAKYEVYLVGVDPVYAKDSRMVMSIADDPKTGIHGSQDLYRLAYWIMLDEVESKLGYMPSAQRLFESNRFEIWEK